MNFRKKLLIFILSLIFLLPINIYAYSDKIILGGNNIGISVNTKEIIVVGFYKVNDRYIAKDSGFIIGDKIIKINNKEINSINDLVDEINNSEDKGNIEVTVIRNDKELVINHKLVKEQDNYKTGLYIKDQITGIGTLTYIDPETKTFGALGHEIVLSSTGKMVDIKSGSIFESFVTNIIKSSTIKTGEKRAIYDQSKTYGTIEKNTNKGIYGIYNDELSNNYIEVGSIDDITLGPAKIYTVLDNNTVKDYDINIININNDSTTKNILFEITDEELIEKANGVIKGMSGSPIVQNDKIIGAVTHAIVSDNTKGYGIFITTMLEEGDKKS